MAALLLGAAACTQRYQLDIPLALNREEMRFTAYGNSYYVMVYCNGEWTASLEREVDWLSFSRTSGSGSGREQIMVSADTNQCVSRGVVLSVVSGTESRELYISQAGLLGNTGSYGFGTEQYSVPAGGGVFSLPSATNLDPYTISCATVGIEYASEGEEWLQDISVEDESMSFSAATNSTGAVRSAILHLSFPLARWDTPVTAALRITQNAN